MNNKPATPNHQYVSFGSSYKRDLAEFLGIPISEVKKLTPLNASATVIHRHSSTALYDLPDGRVIAIKSDKAKHGVDVSILQSTPE